MRNVYVYEHYRPMRENDQLLITISNIDYVTESCGDVVKCSLYKDENIYRAILEDVAVRDIPRIVNDLVYYNHLPQPCNLSLYVIKTTGIRDLPVVIRDILENNLATS